MAARGSETVSYTHLDVYKRQEYIERNTTDHERAQMSRTNAMGTPNDQMSLKEIYDEVWKGEFVSIFRCD